MRKLSFIFSALHLCLYFWTQDDNFFVGSTVFLVGWMVMADRRPS